MRSVASEKLMSLDREVLLVRKGVVLLAKALREYANSSNSQLREYANSSNSERDERLAYKLSAVIIGLESCGEDEE